MKVNKFNLNWQLVRLNAKSIKDPSQKVNMVLDFLNKNANPYNFERVLNWLKMTAIAYPNKRGIFNDAIHKILKDKEIYKKQTIDNDIDMNTVPLETLKALYKDLQSRKYAFQFNKVPRDHVAFAIKLKNSIESR